jgi:hypothetical protein
MYMKYGWTQSFAPRTIGASTGGFQRVTGGLELIPGRRWVDFRFGEDRIVDRQADGVRRQRAAIDLAVDFDLPACRVGQAADIDLAG